MYPIEAFNVNGIKRLTYPRQAVYVTENGNAGDNMKNGGGKQTSCRNNTIL